MFVIPPSWGIFWNCYEVMRLPIRILILQKAFDVLSFLSISHYQALMFKDMSSFAFFAFLRIGEKQFAMLMRLGINCS